MHSPNLRNVKASGALASTRQAGDFWDSEREPNGSRAKAKCALIHPSDVCAPYGGRARATATARPRAVAIFHLNAQVIGRSSGRSSVAAAAYRHGERLVDERTGLAHDYTAKRGVVEVVVLAPSNAPSWVHGPQLWQEVEKVEKRKDAQLCREINLALPVELNHDQRREMLLHYCREQFVSKGMVADVSFHEPDSNNPHAHVMLTMRELTPEGFGNKVREWNSKETLEEWREAWATHNNAALERAGQEARIDHRSLEAQQVAALVAGDEKAVILLNRTATRHHGNRPDSSAHQHNAAVGVEMADALAMAEKWEQWHAREVARQQEQARKDLRADQSPTPDKPAPVSDRDPEEQAWRDQVKARAEQRQHEAETQRQVLGEVTTAHDDAAARFKQKAEASEAAKRVRAKAGTKRKEAAAALAQHQKRFSVRLGFGKSKTAELAEALEQRKRQERASRKKRDTAAVECAEARDTTFALFLEQQQQRDRVRAADEAAQVAVRNWQQVESGRYTWAMEQQRRAEKTEQDRLYQGVVAPGRRKDGLDRPAPEKPAQTLAEATREARERNRMEPPRLRPPGLSRGR